MTVSYDITLATAKDAVRLLLADTQASPNNVFEDEEINGVLNLYTVGTNPYRAAAVLAESIGMNQALLLKVTRVADVTTDGSKVQQQIMAQAASWRETADLYDVQTMGGFDWAEQWQNIFTWRERFVDQALRLNPS